MKNKITVPLTAIFVFLMMGISAVHAGQSDRPGFGKTTNCEACHGNDGCQTVSPLLPKICGQNKEYLVMTMEQFRDGTRPSAIMRESMKTLSNEEIDKLAEYFANMPKK